MTVFDHEQDNEDDSGTAHALSSFWCDQGLGGNISEPLFVPSPCCRICRCQTRRPFFSALVMLMVPAAAGNSSPGHTMSTGSWSDDAHDQAEVALFTASNPPLLQVLDTEGEERVTGFSDTDQEVPLKGKPTSPPGLQAENTNPFATHYL